MTPAGRQTPPDRPCIAGTGAGQYHRAMQFTPGKDLLFREWQAANRKAHAKEQGIAHACMGALEGQLPWPSEQERAEALALRQLADDLFKVAMEEIEVRARANKHGGTDR
jgi:hypothetical protein